MPTHEVTNQVPPLVGADITTHPALREGLAREGAAWAMDEVRELGLLGNSEPGSWPDGSPTSTRRCCTPTTGTATGSTRSSTCRSTTS